MLDVKEELKNYKFLDMDKSLDNEKCYHEDVQNLLKIFSKSYDRIGKEQYKAVNGIDEIIEFLEELKDDSDKIKESRRQLKSKESEIECLIEVLTSVYDMIENMNSFIAEKGNNSLKEQIRLMKNEINEKFSLAGIGVLGKDKVKYNSDCYRAIGTEIDINIPQEEVLKVIKNGYTYKGKLLKKADVIVNKI